MAAVASEEQEQHQGRLRRPSQRLRPAALGMEERWELLLPGGARPCADVASCWRLGTPRRRSGCTTGISGEGCRGSSCPPSPRCPFLVVFSTVEGHNIGLQRFTGHPSPVPPPTPPSPVPPLFLSFFSLIAFHHDALMQRAG